MTGAGFPHSDIHGSKLGRQLPQKTEQSNRIPEGIRLQEGGRPLRPTRRPESFTSVRSTGSSHPDRCESTGGRQSLLRKEVIQPHLPVRLPCYDFTPIADPT